MKEKIENDTETISASEVNRYTYCEFQWYYERVYGRKKLRQLKAARNKELGLTDSTASNFKRGLEYHKWEYRKLRFKMVLTKMLVVAVIVVGLYFVVRMRLGV